MAATRYKVGSQPCDPQSELAQDIVDMTALREKLQEREQYYLDVLEALPVAIYTTDAGGKITYYNQAAADFAGRRPKLGSDEWCVTWRLFWPDGSPCRTPSAPWL
jgi:PAS domain-containing protein